MTDQQKIAKNTNVSTVNMIKRLFEEQINKARENIK